MRLTSRRLRLGFLVLVLATVGVSIWSGFQKLGWFTLWQGTELRIRNGVAEFRHIHALRESVTEEQFRADPANHTVIPPAPVPWEFSFIPDQHRGLGGGTGMVSPADFWSLRFPLWMLPATFLLLWWLVVGFRRLRSSPRATAEAPLSHPEPSVPDASSPPSPALRTA
jgi:hypothetical protein